MTSKVSDRELELLLRKLRAERGFDAHHYRQSYLERRIATRLRAAQVDSYREYRQVLDCNAAEYNQLINALTVNVTEFFRDKPVWEAFEQQVVPNLLERKRSRGQRLVRVWSAGCSGGEEPYSIAMIMLETTRRIDLDCHLTVYATDIDEECLDAARRAVYPIKELQSVPEKYREGSVPVDGGHFTIRPDIRAHVKFRRLDLFADKPIAAVDVIFCRNVLIYFDRAQQQRIFDMFHGALNREGYLVVGKSEKMGFDAMRKFEIVNGREKIYRRREE